MNKAHSIKKLDQIVYLIDDQGNISSSTIRDLNGYMDETTTPRGVGPRLHLRGSELWTWGTGGQYPRMIESFDTEEEAQSALEDTFYQDFMESSIMWYPSREEAENALLAIGMTP